ncbi:porin [uncultured Desulfosarcina sp.]|uniref:porin n=1 Tax=uncultured Desulfosarcina sp. TaxID=218289 RepID=UPI0029C94699|nr:porin [uncultured Desulfosarcina sp.]
MGEGKLRRLLPVCLIAVIVCVLSPFSADGADKDTLDRLEKIIKQQQAQIEAQQKALEQLQGQVEALRGQTAAATVKAATDSPAAVKAGNPKGSVKIYGQVNKAVLYSNDGDDGNFYLVDNDNSSTRVGLEGTITPNDYYTIGTRIEVEYQTNPSNLVNQEDRRLDDATFEKRHLDLWVDGNTIGKFSLGWGSTASDYSSEVDLSGTSVVGYSDIASMAGGQLFYDNNTGRLSGTRIGSVFSNMDGLSRQERIRYDTPDFNGFVGSTSYISDGGGDFAVRYSAQIDAFKLAAAVAYANPGGTSDTIDDQLNGSVSVLHDSGFNGTFAMGTRDNKGDGRDDGAFFYTKFGYRGRWCPLGVTSLSADYGRYSDISTNGDDADVMGFQMVQDLQEWGTEAYLGYRFHKLDRNGTDYDDINAIMTGMRVKF